MEKQMISRRARILQLGLALSLLVSLFAATHQPAAAAAANYAEGISSGSLTIVGVEIGKNVTIKAAGLPANTAVTVRMSRNGSKGASGTIVGTAVTWSDGSLWATYEIPRALTTHKVIVIRVEVTGNAKQFIFNTFSNASGSQAKTTRSADSTNISTVPAGTLSAGNITILEVNEDKSVTFRVTGAPAGAGLAVWIDWRNYAGVYKGKQAGTVKVTASGTYEGTVRLPSAATDRGALRIRLQGLNNVNFLAYKWFINAENYTNSGSSVPPNSTNGLPYILVLEVDKNDSVTIKIFNFPKGEYLILMDELGTRAKDGYEVDEVKITKNAFTLTVDIPDELEGEDEIAIRVEDLYNSSYYAYTWFENETTD